MDSCIYVLGDPIPSPPYPVTLAEHGFFEELYMEVFFSLKIQPTSMRGKEEVWCADITVHGHEEAEACRTTKKCIAKKGGRGTEKKKEDLNSM
jgi:hypothetical protein